MAMAVDDLSLRQRLRPGATPRPPRDDDEMVTGFVAGDEAALKAVYDHHQRLVHSFCRRTVGVDRAADVTQEVFLAAWRSRTRFDASAGSLTGWIMGIARFKAVDALRADSRRPSTADDELVADLTTTADRMDDLALRMLLADSLQQLPERARKMVELAFFDDMTHAEIAEWTGQPLGTVKSDIRRGLERLRRHLEGFDGAPRP